MFGRAIELDCYAIRFDSQIGYLAAETSASFDRAFIGASLKPKAGACYLGTPSHGGLPQSTILTVREDIRRSGSFADYICNQFDYF